ncbi:SUKH-3 domain-containing protein [Paenibacillus agilis]|nr:SUKH-3 domain-containing protein [Paenibacillus agilis]
MVEMVQDLLEKAGWFKGRKVEIGNYLKALDGENYSVFKCASDFLEEYGGLKIKFENPKRPENYLSLNIDPIGAANSIFREVSIRYERYCNEDFVIIGELPPMDMTWYISSSGDFYGGNDDFLIRLGGNFHEALQNVVSGAKLDVIIVEEE